MKNLIKLVTVVTSSRVSSRQLLLALLLTLTMACGGGGGEGGSETVSVPTTVTPPTATPPTKTPTPDPDPEPVPVPEPTSMDDLIVAADNAMQAAFQLAISVDTNSPKRSYFSLCDDFSGSGSNYTVNFESCLYRGPLTSGKLDTDLKIANHNGQLLAVLWFYDGSSPTFKLWQYDTNLEQQSLVLN